MDMRSPPSVADAGRHGDAIGGVPAFTYAFQPIVDVLTRQAIVRAVVQVCGGLGIDVIAKGVESQEEYAWFVECGARLFQGYLFARPGFECLPRAQFP